MVTAVFETSDASDALKVRVTVPVPPVTLRSLNVAEPAEVVSDVVPESTMVPEVVVDDPIEAMILYALAVEFAEARVLP